MDLLLLIVLIIVILALLGGVFIHPLIFAVLVIALVVFLVGSRRGRVP